MRRDLLVCYDISDPARLRKVFQIMRGYGDHLQYSVFRCALSKMERIRLVAQLSEVIHHGEDQVLFVDLGAVDGKRSARFRALGRPMTHPDRHAKVF